MDYVLSTRELGRMIKLYGIDFNNLPESDFNNLMEESSGAGTIFGTTGGVIEAAIRTAIEWLTGEEVSKIDFEELRGLKGIRSAEVTLGDLTLKIGIAHGLGNARKLLDGIKSGEYNFDAIEIMACPGGCIGGGGQPYHHGHEDVLLKRQRALYDIDKN